MVYVAKRAPKASSLGWSIWDPMSLPSDDSSSDAGVENAPTMLTDGSSEVHPDTTSSPGDFLPWIATMVENMPELPHDDGQTSMPSATPAPAVSPLAAKILGIPVVALLAAGGLYYYQQKKRSRPLRRTL